LTSHDHQSSIRVAFSQQRLHTDALYGPCIASPSRPVAARVAVRLSLRRVVDQFHALAAAPSLKTGRRAPSPIAVILRVREPDMRAVKHQIVALASTGLRHVARRSLAVCAASVLVTVIVIPPPAAAGTRAPADPTVVSDWNAIAVTTLLGDPAKSVQEDILYLGFVQAAVYNAVVGIEGRYAPYRFHARALHGASSQASAIAAAHKVLVAYSPDAQDVALDAAYAASLADIADGTAKTRGVMFGEMAADTLIAQRADDGRNAPVLFTQPPAPGVWRPTPPGLLPFTVPWLGAVTPLLVRSGAQFGEPGPPPALTSARYTRDFNEVKELGSAGSTTRTIEQTSTARFFSGNAFTQFNTALRDQATVRRLDIVEAARMFAAVDMSIADALISIWHSKYLYGLWRPITAINLADTDGNPATTADPVWMPLLTTPPYPDYVSGYSGIASAFTRALEETLDTRHLRLTLISTAVPGVTRSYDSGKMLRGEVVDARIWLGIHFRFADTAGARMGEQVADWALDHYFRPVNRSD
jgi:hypothetical protein